MGLCFSPSPEQSEIAVVLLSFWTSWSRGYSRVRTLSGEFCTRDPGQPQLCSAFKPHILTGEPLGPLFFPCLVFLGTQGGVTLPRNIRDCASAFQRPRENSPVSNGHVNASNPDQLPALKASQGCVVLLSGPVGTGAACASCSSHPLQQDFPDAHCWPWETWQPIHTLARSWGCSAWTRKCSRETL